MRADKKRDRNADKAIDILKSLGIEVTKDELIRSQREPDTTKEARVLQGEAAILFLQNPAKFETHKCPVCEEYFGTTYRAVAYCSDAHRNKAFEKMTGMRIDWGAKTDKERWGGEPPLIVDPYTLKHLTRLLTRHNLEEETRVLLTPEVIPPVDPPKKKPKWEQLELDFQETSSYKSPQTSSHLSRVEPDPFGFDLADYSFGPQ